MQYKYAEIADTVYFWFAANLTTGAAGDGASPLYDVRLAGAAAGDAPTASGTPTLLTHANYSDGLHEIAIDTTGYAAGEYAVFCTLTISTVNPAGFCGSFKLRTAGTGALKVDLETIKTRAITCGAAVTVNPSVGAATIQPTVTEFEARTLVSADYTIVSDLGAVQTGDSYAIVNGDHGLVSIQDDVDSILADTGELQTNQGNWLTATGFATPSNITSGTITTVTNLTNNNDKTGYTVSTVSDKTGYALSSTGADLILKSSTFIQAIAAAINELATYGLTALNTLLVTTGIKTATTAAPADMALNSTVAKEATLTLMKGATFDTATDSLEAIRNRGDAAWPTATGFSTHSAADVKTAIEAAGSHLTLIKAKTDNLPSGVSKNTELANFEFLMVLSTDHVTPATGKTITATCSIDGAAFGACTNAAAEVGSGIYKITLAAADLNGDVITLKFSEAACDTRFITIKTEAA